MARKRGVSNRSGVRLSGGEHGGRILPVPAGVRPTEGRVREALFSIWGPRLAGARLLDLFAGSGAVALEAVGRGALAALAVERAHRALEVLEANVERLGEQGAVEVRKGVLPALLATLAEAGERFDLVFADPPYDYRDYPALIAAVTPLLAADGELVVEHSVRRGLPFEAAGLVRADERRYGETGLSFFRRVV